MFCLAAGEWRWRLLFSNTCGSFSRVFLAPSKSKKKSSAETHTSTVQFCIHLSLLHSLILAQCSDKMKTLFEDFIRSKLRKGHKRHSLCAFMLFRVPEEGY